MKHIDILTGDSSLLDRVKPLWTKLNDIHTSTSIHFAQAFEKFSYKVRKASLIADTKNGTLLVEIAVDSLSQVDIGYCITVVNSANKGEIESIYVDQDYQNSGVGDRLMKRAIKWLDEQKASEKVVAVAFGNEKVFPFYEKYGFYPRLTILKQRTEQD